MNPAESASRDVQPIWKEGHTAEEGRPRSATQEQVTEIRRMRSGGETTVALGQRFGVHSSTISRICNGEHWKHL